MSTAWTGSPCGGPKSPLREPPVSSAAVGTRVADSRVQPLSASAAVQARRIICCWSKFEHPDVWLCPHSDAGLVQVLYEDPRYDAVAAALGCSAVSAA